VLRLTAHTVSGIVVFEVPFWGSLTYNGSYLGISNRSLWLNLVALDGKSTQNCLYRGIMI
jgi:hypothetical protein